jgi:hypothetical protein
MASFWSSVLFLPGMIVHEFSHVLGCLLTGVKIHSVKWVGADEAFVQHDKPRASAGLVISLAPFVVGNLLGFWLLQQSVSWLGSDVGIGLLFLWFGVSIILLSFPSKQDAENTLVAFKDSYQKKIFGSNPLFSRFAWLVSVPFVFIPLLLVLGVFLLFNSFFLLRLGWLAGFLFLVGA